MEKIKVDLVVNEDLDNEEKMLRYVLEDEEVQAFVLKKFIDEKTIRKCIGKLYDFVTDKEYCKKCPGIEFCEKNNPCLISCLLYKNGHIETELSPCKKYLAKVALRKRFIYNDFPEEWFAYSLKEIDKTKGRVSVLNAYLDILKGNSDSWLYLKGAQDSGLSFLAASICIDFANRKKASVAFINTKDKIEDLAKNYYKDKDYFDEEMYKLGNAKVLVFDDFMEENKNNLVRDQIILPLIKYRYNKNLLTIFTSKNPINKIKVNYATSKSGEENALILYKLIKEKSKEITLSEIGVY